MGTFFPPQLKTWGSQQNLHSSRKVPRASKQGFQAKVPRGLLEFQVKDPGSKVPSKGFGRFGVGGDEFSLFPFVSLCLPSTGCSSVMISRFVSLCLPSTGSSSVMISRFVSLSLPYLLDHIGSEYLVV